MIQNLNGTSRAPPAIQLVDGKEMRSKALAGTRVPFIAGLPTDMVIFSHL